MSKWSDNEVETLKLCYEHSTNQSFLIYSLVNQWKRYTKKPVS